MELEGAYREKRYANGNKNNFTGVRMVRVFIESHDPWGRKSPLSEADSLVKMLVHIFLDCICLACTVTK